MSRSPAAPSRRRIAWLTAGCVRRSFRAAREKLRSAATVTKTRRSSRVIESGGAGPGLIVLRTGDLVNKYLNY